jgi:hypothetical protein
LLKTLHGGRSNQQDAPELDPKTIIGKMQLALKENIPGLEDLDFDQELQ